MRGVIIVPTCRLANSTKKPSGSTGLWSVRWWTLLHVTASAFLDEFTLSDVSKFRSEWTDGQRSSGKKLERLRTFFSFGQKRKWIPENPASDLRAPKVTLCPTLPFTHKEMLRILAAINKYKDEFPGRGSENAQRMRALVLLLRYGGMRIGDTVSLSGDRIEENRLLLYTQKTGVPVNNVLPDFVLKVLDGTPKVAANYYFWDGESKLETIIGSWRKRLKRLFELAEVSSGHPHRFRDTFAVELLLAGVPIERVSILLGHESVRTTREKLRALGTLAAGTTRSGPHPCVGPRSCYSCPNFPGTGVHGGYTRKSSVLTHTF